ncbi:hypothetical protein VSDG_01955 [Cytospora chrysosperma]|uniref:Uncharacterized protein n=1 Tax=Cytospora chrysosperma TaxID=252740 RepID=A0A423WHB2_CYTCH|nr:hypothetical protein VSDG_01955 [Valsa sordida]
MVQFVFTPWRDRAELLRVRSQFYPPSATSTPASASTTAYTPSEIRAIQKAIARVFMWVHRGHCPHVVESTAMLMSAVVLDRKLYHHHHHGDDHDSSNSNDDDGGDEEEEDDAASDYGVRAAYLTAFTRFVTGLLDGHQDKARKLSMYGVARTVGLPAGFVELRHQGTHEAMPGLAQLRPAAARALRWIWEYYWRNLPGGAEGDHGARDGDGDGRADEAVAGAGVGSGGALGGGGGGGGGFLAAAAASAGVGTTSGDGVPAVAATSGIRERMCRRALTGYLQRQAGEAGEEAAREALMRQLSQWDDLLVVRVLADIGQSARDAGVLARSVRLSREILGRATGRGVQDGTDTSGDVQELRDELSRARMELESTQESGKRKRAIDDDNGPGWKRWEGPWTPRPIGIL